MPDTEERPPKLLYIRPTTDFGGTDSVALNVLRRLDKDKISLRERDSDDLGPNVLLKDIDSFDAVVVRPTRGGNTIADNFNELRDRVRCPFIVGSIAANPNALLSELCMPKPLAVQHSKLSLNAESVADLTVWYAINRFRPLAAAVQGMAFVNQTTGSNLNPDERLHLRIEGIEDTTTLVGKNWLLVGMGTQAELLVLRLEPIREPRFYCRQNRPERCVAQQDGFEFSYPIVLGSLGSD